MSLAAMLWALRLELDPRAKVVLFSIADFADPSGYCWPSITAIAKNARLSTRTVMRQTAQMEKAGLLTVTRGRTPDGKQEVNTYRLKIEPGDKLSHGAVQPGDSTVENRVTVPGDSSVTPTVIGNHQVKPSHPLTTFAGGAPTQTLAPEDVPEWLVTLRGATPYSLSPEREVALVDSVDQLGLSDDVVWGTAASLASQWPYKKHKHLDLTFMAWLRKETVSNVAPRAEADAEATARYVARRKLGPDLLDTVATNGRLH